MRACNLLRSSIALVAAATVVIALALPAPAAAPPRSAGSTPAQLVVTRAKGPARSVVTDASGAWVATFTDGSRTVAIAGPERTLSEPGVTAVVRSTTWVRLLPAPFERSIDHAWLAAARGDPSSDVLATSLQYVAGAPEVRDGSGQLLSSDASYGPLLPDGTRQEGSDWNDYRGVAARYGDRNDAPEVDQAGSLDCSGFMRMLWGVRHDIPLSLDMDGQRLPRRAVQQLASAPGTVVVPDRGTRVKSLSRLQPGDLVFFDASTDDGAAVDHVGMYLGRDSRGSHRFISSRKSIDGPTMGDHRGRSTLDGSGLYASSFRATRRL